MKILVITSRVPWPLEKGDKLRAYHQLRLLAGKHEVILCALNDTALHPDAEKELKKFCREVHAIRLGKAGIFFSMIRGLFNGLPFQVAYFTSGSARRRIDSIIASHKPDRIYCQLIRTAEYARHHAGIPRVIDYMDVFSKGVERRISKVNALKRPLFRMEWKRLLRYETEVFSHFEKHAIISSQDRDLMPVKEKEKIVVIPNGVDTDFFSPVDAKKDYELLFNGNMSYPPNVESVLYIAQKILPLVWKKHPQVRLLISGANPSAEVSALQSDRITVTGWVDDVRESFARSKMLVAPMQSSIGLQNKLLEAMAMRLPCITTTLSNNAIKAVPDSQVLVADTPQQFATHIEMLLEFPEKAQQLADNGYKMVHDRFNWKQTSLQLEQLIIEAGKR
jgi:sugar transferase (PEP-CTERM/EpsH1 system associated)